MAIKIGNQTNSSIQEHRGQVGREGDACLKRKRCEECVGRKGNLPVGRECQKTALGVSHSLSSHPKLIATPRSQTNDTMIKNKAHAAKAPRQHDDSTRVIWKASLACERRPPTGRTTLNKQFPNPTCRQTIDDHGNQK